MSGEFAGTLRERVAIERRGEDRDALGGASGAWAPLGEAWAAVAPDGAGVEGAGDAPGAAPRWRVTIRARDVRPADRLRWKGRLLAVCAVEADPRTPERIVLRTEEGR